MRMMACTESLYATARIPPRLVYKPVNTSTSTEPIQKLLIGIPPTDNCISGSSVRKTTPPA